MTSQTTRHPDGTVDIVQRGPVSSDPQPQLLERLYWHEVARTTFGLARFSRDAIRVLGLWPVLLRFGPLQDGGRAIRGGIFARRAQGDIRWWARDGEVVVAVERFAPLLGGPLWRVESWFHAIVGRRFVAAVSRRGG